MSPRWSIHAAAREAPDRTAVITGAQRWSYRALAERVDRVAAAMAGLGVPMAAPEAGRVMMTAPNTIDSVCALLALFERGVPVMLTHPRSTLAERDALAHAYPPAFRLDDGPPAPAATGLEPPSSALEVPADHDLAVFFTSGTTGRPKAVRLSRRAFAASAAASAENLGWRDHDRWLLAIPLAHVGGLSVLTRCLLARRTVVLADGPFRPPVLADLCRETKVTLMSLVPTQLRRWLPDPPASTVRAVLLGGAPASPVLRDQARRAGWPILATYGLTEACSQVTVQRPEVPAVAGDVDSGWPISGTDVQVRGDRILIKGPTLLTGYLTPAGEPPPASPIVDGWFDTGDVGRLTEDGRLVVQARRTDLILSGGENVYPAEVENALAEHPEVLDAVVFGLDDPDLGQIVAAAVVLRAEAGPAERLGEDLRDRLAGPKRPRAWVSLDRFAVTPSGKVDRREVVSIARRRLACTTDG